MLRIAILVSGSGTNLQALLDAIAADPDFGGEVVVVASDQAGAQGLDRARAAGVPAVAVELPDFPDRHAWEKALVAELEVYEPDLIVSAGFMRLLSGDFLSRWPARILNVHPSLLPAFRGAHAVREALAYGVRVTGTTVHFVDEEVDHGPIVAQRAVDVLDGDDEASLHERIKAAEHEVFPAAVKLLCHGRLLIEDRHVRILPARDARALTVLDVTAPVDPTVEDPADQSADHKEEA